MKKSRSATTVPASIIWEKPEPSNRTRPLSLTRLKVVHTAMAVADEKGLAAVSLRNVASALNASPMRLYAYISTKEELLDLMVDAVYEELLSEGTLPQEWANAMRAAAQRLRGAAKRHPWFLDLIGGRPHQGPSALGHLESLLAVLYESGVFAGIDSVLQGLKTFQAYVTGALQSEASEARETQQSGLTKTQWQSSTEPYLSRMIASGRFPTIAKVMVDANHPPSDKVFEDGLECVLKGISSKLGNRKGTRVSLC